MEKDRAFDFQSFALPAELSVRIVRNSRSLFGLRLLSFAFLKPVSSTFYAVIGQNPVGYRTNIGQRDRGILAAVARCAY